MNPVTLLQVLQHSSKLSNRGITFIEQGGHESFLGYGELYRLAQHGLGMLQDQGLQPKDELVFQVEDNRSFIILFWSCILGGIIPVPLSPGKNDDQKAKLFNVWQILNNPWLIADAIQLERIAQYGLAKGEGQLFARIKERSVDMQVLDKRTGAGVVFEAKPADIAFIQFSSGSTGSPKGVVLTHENLITNVAAIAAAARYQPDDTTISWMPLTHDMGLIGFHINPLFSQMNQCLMPTGLFVRNPTLWLSKVKELKVTILCSPNFGYKYLLKYFKESADYKWDLSGVRIIYNGAEPISESLAGTFLDKLAAYGLKKSAMCPVYGLAEASLAVSMSQLCDELISIKLDRNHLNPGNAIQPKIGDRAISFVNVGKAINDVSLKIANDEGKSLDEGVIGRIHIKGKNVTAAYYNNSEATGKVIDKDNWLDTGDLGFLLNGCLYVTGRAKDIFFVNGQNFYPHDIERIGEGVDGIELNKIVVCGIQNAASEEVISFVFHRGKLHSFLSLSQSLKAHVNAQTGIEIARVVPITDIPKTTSGKLQRFKLARQYKAGNFDQILKDLDQLEREAGIVAEALPEVPQNKTEELLLESWQALLGDKSISTADRFFEIGGNSLKAAELCMRILRDFQVELTLADLYDQQSIQQQAALIDSLEKSDYALLQKVNSGAQKVTPFQRRLYFFQETNPAAIAYNIPVVYEIKGKLDISQLEHSLNTLIKRWDILRTAFVRREHDIYMEVQVVTDFKLHTIKTNCLPQDFTQLIRPFDLSKAGQFSATLLLADDQRNALLLDFHHIIMDGVSVAILIKELMQLYEETSLPIPEIQYTDFARWLETYYQEERTRTARAYWLSQLKGELPLLNLPLDKTRPARFDHRGKKRESVIQNGKSEKLRELARANECSMHVLMLAAYGLLLNKYTGQGELIIGLPVTVRNHPEISRLPGMFVNNLAIKIKVDPKKSFAEFLSALQQQMTGALSHDYPFDTLLNDLELKRDLSRNPLMDTMFIYQNMELPETESVQLQLEQLFVDPETAKYDLSQEIFDTGSGPLKYAFEYATALFHDETINRLSTHFETLLDRLVANPGQEIARLSLLPFEAYEEQLFHFNDTDKDYSGNTVLDLFNNQVFKSPEHVAIVCDGESVTYKDLDILSTRVAKSIVAFAEGVSPIVPICADRSSALIVGILGILKSGRAYLPIDTSLPSKRIQYLLSDSESNTVLTTTELQPGLESSLDESCQLLLINDLSKGSQPNRVLPEIDQQNLAYVLYTSGTTGQPKGVKITHEALHNYISWAGEQYTGPDCGDFALFTSISFDLTITSIFTPITTGKTIFVYDEKPEDKEHLVVKVVRDKCADVIKLTPSHLRLLQSAGLGAAHGVGLKKIIVGGESLETSLAASTQELLGDHIAILNEYGPTEATVGCMIYEFNPEDQFTNVPIGVPAANTRIYLLDEHLQPVATGVRGELYISGLGLSTGYLNNPEQTDARFIQNPFVLGQRMYKTGDLARRLPCSALEFSGRADEQLKLNGYRIEPNELISCLSTLPAVLFVAVGLRELNGSKVIYCYVQCNEQEELPDEPVLKSKLAEQLPFYMIPARILSVDQFPMTDNGKIDYKALASLPTNTGVKLRQTPVSSIEQTFIEAWRSILGVDPISPDDNFFELGGDSIKAVQIVSRLHENGISVQVRDLLTYHSIRGIVDGDKFTMVDQSVDQGSLTGHKELSPVESWFFNQNFANPAYYNQSLYLAIKKPLNVQLLEKAFEILVSHHDGLRLNYDQENKNLLFNESHLDTTFRIGEVDLSHGLEEKSRSVEASLDLSHGLLLKALVFSKKGDQRYLFITAHHLVTDGLSWRILLHDLLEVYQALEQDSEPVLPQKTTSLVQWQRQLEEFNHTANTAAQRYWQSTSTGFQLPLDSQPVDWSVAGIHRQELTLDEDSTRFLIKEAFKAYNTDVFTLLNVALIRTFDAWRELRELIVEHENHGRHLDNCDVSRTTGWFTALYPVRLRLEGSGLPEQIMSVKEQITAVPDHGLSYPLGKSELPRKQSEVRFNYLGEFHMPDNDYLAFSDIGGGLKTDPKNQMTTKLELNAMVMNNRFTMEVASHKQAFSEQSIKEFCRAYLFQLNQMLDHLRNQQEIYFTPSDFEAALNQEELDELFN